MDLVFRYLILFIKALTAFDSVRCDTYDVKVSTEQHVNQMDSRFLSFTIDPKYLIGSGERYDNKHCLCMASSLTPAYLRIAGPSTSQMTFNNSTMNIEDAHATKNYEKFPLSIISGRKDRRTSMTHKQWGKFVRWAERTGFDLVFALNDKDKMALGMWDPNKALNALTAAVKANVSDMTWQLGYECANQSIEEYLNDLETLRVIVETFHADRSTPWRVVAGDVTPCLPADSKSDFKDYVTLCNDMFDAIFLNGNSSAQQLEKMSDADRQKLLRLLSKSDTPLWLTEKVQVTYNELERAADWLASLGYAARNGFSVHFRELLEDELHQPTLSFYMALLYKNLVGDRVLDLNMTVSKATMFAHCTWLRRKPVPGAVTLYGANMDDEPARFSLKLSKKEDGGDIMQFIFGHDSKGNIIVNGRAMYLEGDITPVVKRVRPFKTLLLNLPPKSFGFWVLANTHVDACFYKDGSNKNMEIEPLPIELENVQEMNVVKAKSKRSLDVNESFVGLDERNTDQSFEESKNNILRKQIDSLHVELKSFYDLINNNSAKRTVESPPRVKRQALDKDNVKKPNKKGARSKYYRNVHEKHFDLKPKLFDKLMQYKNDKLSKLTNRKYNKKTFKRYSNGACSEEYIDIDVKDGERARRRRRAVDDRTDGLEDGESSKQMKRKLYKETFENEVGTGDHYYTVGNSYKKLKGALWSLPMGTEDGHAKAESVQDSSGNEIVLRTKLSDDGAVINISEKAHHGLLSSTFGELTSVLADLNKNLNRFWSTLTLLE